MLNSKHASHHESRLSNTMSIEQVQPADGRGETRYFLMVCFGVLLLAGGLLSLLHGPSKPTLSSLPESHSNLATQISNALEEITLLEEAGMLLAPYQLKDLPLPQLATVTFIQQNSHCFTLLHQGVLFAVQKEESTWQAQWVNSTRQRDCHAPLDWNALNQ
ncbi:hypothetical protein [Marinomonas algarum]|uniref:Uncharacterized protein n=1 Tax=Marinomonas algarum TaxID=2883105 RepID=A0A9X1IKA2_9GAMM|nr:hypothetical protein [Marinomonas algarum]MCB5161079.1 hypothetical protein [Marinomonas algarum]